MRVGAVFASLALLLLLLAGCLGTNDDVIDAPVVVTGLAASSTPLWSGPQDFPHPAYDYPTLTNPAVNGTVPRWWQPIPAVALPDPVTGVEHLAGTADEFDTGAGMALFGSLAVVPGGDGTRIVDISDPAAPKLLATADSPGRGAAFIPYPNGTLVFVISTDEGVDRIYDITDPTDPRHVFDIQPTAGSHKVAVVPGTPILYNANSAGGGPDASAPTGITEIYDLSDPWDPKLVMDWPNGYGCHHIYFHIRPDADHFRALCAGIEMTQIWDIKDPLQPEVLVNIPVPHGDDTLPAAALAPATFSHAAILSDDHTILIVGDETGGGIAPGCDPRVETPLGPALDGPLGNLWFYDVSDENDPKLLSWLSPGPPFVTEPPTQAPEVDPTDPLGTAFRAIFESGINCTSHHGRLIPDPTRDLLAWAFYGAGVVIIDFTDPAGPFIVDEWSPGTQTWEVWYYNGYLFTGDLNRGLDVLRIV